MKKLKRHVSHDTDSILKSPQAEERIRQRAHEIHRARGGGPGRELDDWLQAERELLAEQEHRLAPDERAASARTADSASPISEGGVARP